MFPPILSAPMSLAHLHNGDVVYACIDIRNDGSVPDADGDAPFATAGAKGMLLNIGHFGRKPKRGIIFGDF